MYTVQCEKRPVGEGVEIELKFRPNKKKSVKIALLAAESIINLAVILNKQTGMG